MPEMSDSDNVIDAEDVKDSLDMVNAVGERLATFGSESFETRDLLDVLDVAQQGLQVAGSLISESPTDVIDHHRGVHWWQRKLIATLPMAVVETEADGRIVWANSAAALLLGRDVLRLVRTRLHKALHVEDQAVLDNLLTGMSDGRPLSGRTILRLGAGAMTSIELVPASAVEIVDGRHIFTWVLQPVSAHDEGVDGSLIAETFSKLCLLPLKSGSLQELLSEVARLCEDVSAPHSSVSVSIGPPADPARLASSTTFAQNVDAAQISADEGPCQEAWETRAIVFSDNAAVDPRWPKFARAADGTGMASALAAPIMVGDDMLGILNVYSTQESAFGARSMRVIELLADAAGAVIHHVDEEKQLKDLASQLEESIRSREIIEQAKGALMAQHGCTADEALARLSKVSQDRNIRMRLLAERLVASLRRADDTEVR